MDKEEQRSKYFDMNIAQLKAELRKRNALVSGRKHELVQRLEDYDRNQNFNKADNVIDNYVMTLPEKEDYMDVNSETEIPSVTHESVDSYLQQFEKKLDCKARNLYHSRYFLYIRSCTKESYCFIHAKCCAEMKKQVAYNVDIQLNDCGTVHECQCECAAGSGPEAHCKHVATLLYGLALFMNDRSSLITQETCTSKLQTFYVPKPFKGSLAKLESLQFRTVDAISLKKFDPRPPERRETEGYKDRVLSMIMNLKNPCEIPTSQHIPPANLRALANDHDYDVEHKEDKFLSELNVHPKKPLAADVVQSVEKSTRGQQKNQAWWETRRTRIQSSPFGKICEATDRLDKRRLARSLISGCKFTSVSVRDGIQHEPVALTEYTKKTCNQPSDCGIFVCQDYPFLGSSPDGIVDDELKVEVKCPYSARNRPITSTTVPYLRDQSEQLSLNQAHDYYYQIQGQLRCSKRTACDLVVFTLKDLKVIRIVPDENFIKEMINKLRDFHRGFFQQTLLDILLYRDYDRYF